MKKMFLLRDFLLDGPLNIDPENLLMFNEDGTCEDYPGDRNSNYRMHYECVVIVTEYADDTDKLFYLILNWIADHQPFLSGVETFKFRADINSHDSADVEIRIQLDETILVEETPAGVRLTHDSEPALEPVDLPIPNEVTIYEDITEPGDDG